MMRWPGSVACFSAWTIEVKHNNAHKKGAPGLFGFSPQSQKTVFVDNIPLEVGPAREGELAAACRDLAKLAAERFEEL